MWFPLIIFQMLAYYENWNPIFIDSFPPNFTLTLEQAKSP